MPRVRGPGGGSHALRGRLLLLMQGQYTLYSLHAYVLTCSQALWGSLMLLHVQYNMIYYTMNESRSENPTAALGLEVSLI